jgi:hypothetical protein
MSVVEYLAVARDIVIVLVGSGAALAWTWVVWQWYWHVLRPSRSLNGRMAAAKKVVEGYRVSLDIERRLAALEHTEESSPLGPLDSGPPS